MKSKFLTYLALPEGNFGGFNILNPRFKPTSMFFWGSSGTLYFRGNPQSLKPPKYRAVLRSILWCIFEIIFVYF